MELRRPSTRRYWILVALALVPGCRSDGGPQPMMPAGEARFHLTPTSNIVCAQRTYIQLLHHDAVTGTATLYLSPPGLVVVREVGDYVEDAKRFRLDKVRADGVDLTYRLVPPGE